MRMRINIGRTSVRSPARMTDTRCSDRHIAADFILQGCKTADALFDADFLTVINGDTGRIVTAVLKLGQSFQQETDGLFVTDISDNTTHNKNLL